MHPLGAPTSKTQASRLRHRHDTYFRAEFLLNFTCWRRHNELSRFWDVLPRVDRSTDRTLHTEIRSELYRPPLQIASLTATSPDILSTHLNCKRSRAEYHALGVSPLFRRQCQPHSGCVNSTLVLRTTTSTTSGTTSSNITATSVA